MISFETSKCPLNNSNIAIVMDPKPNLESPPSFLCTRMGVQRGFLKQNSKEDDHFSHRDLLLSLRAQRIKLLLCVLSLNPHYHCNQFNIIFHCHSTMGYFLLRWREHHNHSSLCNLTFFFMVSLIFLVYCIQHYFTY